MSPRSTFTVHCMRRLAGTRERHFSLVMKAALLLLWLTGPTWLHSQTIAGTVQDPSGAVIVDARIEITGGVLAHPLVLSSNGVGEFVSPETAAAASMFCSLASPKRSA